MVTGYEVYEDGTLQEVELSKEDLDTTKVVCVVDDETKSIYLWKGSQAGIRRKFIGARVATNLRTEYGFHFKSDLSMRERNHQPSSLHLMELQLLQR